MSVYHRLNKRIGIYRELYWYNIFADMSWKKKSQHPGDVNLRESALRSALIQTLIS